VAGHVVTQSPIVSIGDTYHLLLFSYVPAR